jgi:hypothetical protein
MFNNSYIRAIFRHLRSAIHNFPGGSSKGCYDSSKRFQDVKGQKQMSIRELLLVAAMLAFPFAVQATPPQWQDSTLAKMETGRGHTPLFHDVEVTSYSFKLNDGTVYIADSRNRTLDVTMNGHTRLRFEKDGHVGDYIHILDDSGKDIKLHIVGKVAPAP